MHVGNEEEAMEYNYDYNVEAGGLGILLAIYIVVILAIYVVAVIGLWKMYVKAGRPGWAAIVPVYNWWVWVEIIGRPRWWFWAFLAYVLLSWVPIVNIILGIMMFVLFLMGCLDMAKCFGKGTGTGIGLWLLSFVFAPILGFGDAQYIGPTAAGVGQPGGTPPPPPPAGGTYAPPPAPPAPPTTPPATPQPPVTPPTTPPAPPAETPPAAPPAGSPPPPPPLQ
jgi:hypothetical protein